MGTLRALSGVVPEAGFLSVRRPALIAAVLAYAGVLPSPCYSEQ